jgi:hypothetical protein
VGDDEDRASWRDPSPRELVEQRLEPGEPIEAFVAIASTGPAAERRANVTLTVTATASVSLLGVTFLRNSIAIAVTDRRVFFVRDATRTGVRIEPKNAVRVLEYDCAGPSNRLWLNVDGHQVGYRIGKRYRAATDALVNLLGGAPPSLTRTEDR